MTVQTLWDARLAATSAVTDHRDAVEWLRHRLAAALRSHVEADRAAAWNPDLQPTGVRLAGWLAHAYGYITTVPAGDLTAGAEMPMVGHWLADRADRLTDVPLLIASPAAGAAAVAAAQALTNDDITALAVRTAELPYADAHLTLSAPVTVTTDSEGTSAEEIHALSWWPDGGGFRVADWISTFDTLTGAEADSAEAAARAYGGATLPALMLDTERLHPQAWAAPVTSDRHETEGQFSFDVPVYDPAGDLFVRLALVVRHLVATGVLHTGVERVRPPGSTGHVTRTPVVVLRTEDDDRHTTRLALPGSSVAMRRRRPGSNLQWSGPFG
ncbi:hypothetical protein SIM91_05685 [Rhodococcus opacus]|uniref:hypothetical protein n=1 Tax=Rhodococcus opacus TaxID=37919 RepID=UPI0002A44F9C|nr:hypothetical protein [Rhodococcus opacus]ELB87130.1 hypothetical protein Rwratislav_41400 [Rhodococcus wratislaviensis IFP 2016]MDX5962805.1 hypothetical protein [Rhodococcus opacus]CAG7637684.1 hypothetical protein E143388_07919 [Rhodococcus opacus]